MVDMTTQLVAVLLLMSAAAAASPVMHEYDRSARNRTGLKASDVCLSFRFFRKEATIEDLMRMWKPSRIEWSYVSTPETIEAVHKAGLVFVGTLNTIAWDGPDQDGELFDGGRMVAPWMTGFNSGKGVGWACVNKAPTLPRRIEHLRKYQALGVNTIQHDDWMFNLHGVFWGGCFCKDCRRGFAEYLAQNASADEMRAVGVETWKGFDYLDYLKTKLGRTSTKDYLDRRGSDPLCTHFRMFQLLSTRSYFEKLVGAGKDVRLTVNSNAKPARIANSFLLDMTDYLVGETEFQTEDDLDGLACALKMADALNLPQIVSPHPKVKPPVPDVRRAIGLTYALGHRMLAPWDVYVNSEADRWFGKVEDYGDIYDFVRTNAALLDGYAAFGNVVLAVPISTNPAAMTAAGKAADLLMRAGYPCRFAAYGIAGEIVHVPVDPSDFRQSDVAVNLKGGGKPADTADLERAIAGLKAVDFEVAGASERDYRTLAGRVGELGPPAYRVDDAKLMVLPRWKPGDPKAPRVVHLVNMGGAKRASLWLSEQICGSNASTDVVLLQPGKPAVNLRATESRGGLSFTDLAVDEWGMLAINPG